MIFRMRMFRKSLPFSLIFILFACNSQEKVAREQESTAVLSKADPFRLPELPEYMLLCGDTIRLTDLDLRERLDRELLVNVFYQSATTLYLKRSTRFLPKIEAILKENDMPDDLKYIAVIESGLAQAVSPAGARGMWQFMETTGKELGLQIDPEVDERYDVAKSTSAACTYLRSAYDTLKSWPAAIASYNRGISGMLRDMDKQYVSSYFDTDMNSETGRYFFRLLAMKLIFEDPEAYGYYLKEGDYYPPYQVSGMEIKETVPDLALWATEHGINYKILTILNPWLRGNSLTVKTKTYTLLLPTENEHLKPYGGY